MTSALLEIRASRDRDHSAKMMQKAETELRKVKKAAEKITQMTELYRQRLEGTLHDQS